MKKRIFSILLSCALAFSLLPFSALAHSQDQIVSLASTAYQTYTDVSNFHWAYQSINTCSQRGWFGGYPDGSFHPNSLVSRAEAAKVFVSALGLPWDKNAPITYTDTQGHWAAGLIEAGKQLFPDTTNLVGTQSFRPAQAITREEAIYALVVAWRFVSETQKCDESVLNMFADQGSISVAVRPYVAVAVQKGLVSGIPDPTMGTIIGAQKGLTRAEFATILAKALQTAGIGGDDTSAPRIELDQSLLQNNSVIQTTKSSLTMTGRVISDAINNVTLQCNGMTVVMDATGRFSFDVRLPNTSNEFKLTARTIYGGTANEKITVLKDNAKATIRLFGQIPSKTSQSSITIDGRIDHYGDDCILFMNNYKAQVDSNGSFHLTLDLLPGRNNFELTVERAGTRQASEKISIERRLADNIGKWVETLPRDVTEDSYEIETKNQFRIQTREIKKTNPAPESPKQDPKNMNGWVIIEQNGSWGAWSEWQDLSITASDTREVETRNTDDEKVPLQYRCRNYVIDGITVWERWSSWSEWQDGTREADDNTKVETRTLYRYELN